MDTSLLRLLLVTCIFPSVTAHKQAVNNDKPGRHVEPPVMALYPHFLDEDEMQDEEHIREHMRGMKEDSPSATQKEFYYFTQHDFNSDSHLDGLELLASLRHSRALELNMKVIDRTHHGHPLDDIREAKKTVRLLYLNRMAGTIDQALEKYDDNKDGRLSYTEFKMAAKLHREMRQAEKERYKLEEELL